MNLYKLVDQLAGNISPFAYKKRIINNINPFLQAEAREEILNDVLRSLLEQATRHSKNEDIMVAAKAFHNVILVHIKYNDPRSESEIEKKLAEADRLAGTLEGCLYITSSKLSETTISFTFLSHQQSVAA